MPRIKIEEKHVYTTQMNTIGGNIREDQVVAPLKNYIWFTPNFPDQGTDEDQRIGRKIQAQSIGVEGYLTINTDVSDGDGSYPDLLYYWNGYMQQSMFALVPDAYEFNSDWQHIKVPIRHMVVEFYQDEFYNGDGGEKAVYLQDWFNQLVIHSLPYTDQVQPYGSNQQQTLRESTTYTGEFKILKDTVYWLIHVTFVVD